MRAAFVAWYREPAPAESEGCKRDMSKREMSKPDMSKPDIRHQASGSAQRNSVVAKGGDGPPRAGWW